MHVYRVSHIKCCSEISGKRYRKDSYNEDQDIEDHVANLEY